MSVLPLMSELDKWGCTETMNRPPLPVAITTQTPPERKELFTIYYSVLRNRILGDFSLRWHQAWCYIAEMASSVRPCWQRVKIIWDSETFFDVLPCLAGKDETILHNLWFQWKIVVVRSTWPSTGILLAHPIRGSIFAIGCLNLSQNSEVQMI